jgi:hypothetical protein
MKPNTNKPKTGRRFRGLEVAQAVLLLVLGVVVAMTLYFLTMNMVQTTPVPPVQLEPYQSFVFIDSRGNVFFNPALRFGRAGKVIRVDIHDEYLNVLSVCYNADWTGPLSVVPGMVRGFSCYAGGKVPRIVTVTVLFDDWTEARLRWVVS